MKYFLSGIIVIALMFAFSSCGESTDVVESGIYQVTVKKVEADKKEIYVETTDGKTLELYFIDETELTKNGEPAEFSDLKAGQNVEVEIKKVGKRLDPLTVDIKE
jgi:hypothetical protein